MSAPLKIFIIYAREDKSYKDDLLKSLKLLQTQGLIEPWHDSDIKPGDEWDREIKAHLRAADIILPIISFDFFDSDYIHRVEIVEAFERYDRGKALIIPIIADACPWTDYPRLKDFQVLPAEGKPIDDWPDRKKALSSIYEGVKGIILEKRRKQEKREEEEHHKRIKVEAEKVKEKAEYFFVLAFDSTEPDEQIKYYSKAIDLNPKYTDAYINRGTVKGNMGYYEEAIKDYEQAIIINPDDGMAYFNRSVLLQKTGQPFLADRMKAMSRNYFSNNTNFQLKMKQKP